MVDNAYISTKFSNEISVHTSLNMSTYPALPEEQEQARRETRNIFLYNAAGVWMTLVFAVTYFSLISDLIYEKETKIREAMKVINLL